MDPFHLARLVGDALDRCWGRVWQDLHGHRGRGGDPLYRGRRTLHTGKDLLTDRQRARIEALFATDEYVQVEAAWGIYQRMIGAYRRPDRAKGWQLMAALIESVSRPGGAERGHHSRRHVEEASRGRAGLPRVARNQ